MALSHGTVVDHNEFFPTRTTPYRKFVRYLLVLLVPRQVKIEGYLLASESALIKSSKVTERIMLCSCDNDDTECVLYYCSTLGPRLLAPLSS